MTMNLPIENFSPFVRIAQIYCPFVYEQLVDQKEFLLEKTKTSKYFFTNFSILLFGLSISFLSIFLLLLTGSFLSYLTSIRLMLLAVQHKFNVPI
ncbi:unnamed protein product [Adineta steineri]|nr:unnamed protein product [Adineta steineri]